MPGASHILVTMEDELVSRLGKKGGSGGARLLRVGDIVLDPETCRLEVNGEISILTPKQSELLSLFMSRPGEVLTRKQIIKEVWKTDYTGDTRTLDVHIHWVRRKLGDVHREPRYLQTVRGVGYLFVDLDRASPTVPVRND
jgi:DNA-binding response OmpR family regulator